MLLETSLFEQSDLWLPFLLLVFCIGVGGVAFWCVLRGFHARVKRAKEGQTVSQFVVRLQRLGYDASIARQAYRYLIDHENLLFPIVPNDRLREDLGMNDLETVLMVRQVSQSCAKELPEAPLAECVTTVGDVVQLVQELPEKHTLAA